MQNPATLLKPPAYPTQWKKPPFISNPILRYTLIIGAIVYLILAIGSLDINWLRLSQGWERAWVFVKGFLTPDFTTRGTDIRQGMVESLTMALTSTAAGIVISIPIAVGAAKNLSPHWIYYICRAIIALSRTLNEIIVAIFMVALFGFGAFAGFLTLAFATIGFLAKLLAEDIEEIQASQLDALKATGAGFLQTLDFAVLSQCLPRLVGLSLYRLDINFRESAVIGIIGAGGIGGTLSTAMDRYEYSSAGAVLILIIAIVIFATVVISEWITMKVRQKLL